MGSISNVQCQMQDQGFIAVVIDEVMSQSASFEPAF